MSYSLDYSKVIEFFWFFVIFLLFLLAALKKLYLKTSIHSDQGTQIQNRQSQQPIAQKYAQPQGQHQQSQGEELNGININLQEQKEHGQGQQQSISAIELNLEENTKTAKLFKGVDEYLSEYFSLFGVVIICIINYAVYEWALAASILYLVFVLVFNVIEIQKKSSNLIRQILKQVHNIWIFGLFINYFACSLVNY